MNVVLVFTINDGGKFRYVSHLIPSTYRSIDTAEGVKIVVWLKPNMVLKLPRRRYRVIIQSAGISCLNQ